VVHYCKKCVSVNVAATPLTFDQEGVCSGCRVDKEKRAIDWDKRKTLLQELVDEYRSSNNYDLVIPVSGGKDSYYQTHYAVHELHLKPLLVTYHANNYLPEGEENLYRMRKVFDVDHIIIQPSESVLRKMNRIGFFMQGDMNWHAHCGIFTTPIQIAVKYKVPLILWGEHGFMDLGGMYSYKDFVEYTAKHRFEHALRGFDWYDFTDSGLEKRNLGYLKEGLSEKDLMWAQYPADNELLECGVRGIYLSNYVNWDGVKNALMMQKLYAWKEAAQPFERTYRRQSNLDDMHENGIHDYLKFVKFGYGRGTDHALKDIRAGRISREQGIEYVKKYDHVKPTQDLHRWLEYTGLNEEQFDVTADRFRDPRVWWIEDGHWWKETIWGQPQPFGPVFLPHSEWEKYIKQK